MEYPSRIYPKIVATQNGRPLETMQSLSFLRWVGGRYPVDHEAHRLFNRLRNGENVHGEILAAVAALDNAELDPGAIVPAFRTFTNPLSTMVLTETLDLLRTWRNGFPDGLHDVIEAHRLYYETHYPSSTEDLVNPLLWASFFPIASSLGKWLKHAGPDMESGHHFLTTLQAVFDTASRRLNENREDPKEIDIWDHFTETTGVGLAAMWSYIELIPRLHARHFPGAPFHRGDMAYVLQQGGVAPWLRILAGGPPRLFDGIEQELLIETVCPVGGFVGLNRRVLKPTAFRLIGPPEQSALAFTPVTMDKIADLMKEAPQPNPDGPHRRRGCPVLHGRLETKEILFSFLWDFVCEIALNRFEKEMMEIWAREDSNLRPAD